MNQTQKPGVTFNSLIESKKRSKSPFDRGLAKSPFLKLPEMTVMETYGIKKCQGRFQIRTRKPSPKLRPQKQQFISI